MCAADALLPSRRIFVTRVMGNMFAASETRVWKKKIIDRGGESTSSFITPAGHISFIIKLNIYLLMCTDL